MAWRKARFRLFRQDAYHDRVVPASPRAGGQRFQVREDLVLENLALRQPLLALHMPATLVGRNVNSSHGGSLRLVVQNDIEQRTMDLQRAFRTSGIVNEAEFPEPVHEEADSRTSRPDHLSERLLADLGDHGFRNAILAKMSEQ